MIKRILFLPNDIGGGLGHVRRSSRLAEILLKFGFEIGFIIHKKKTIDFLKQFKNLYYVPFNIDKFITLALSKIKPIHPFPKEPIKSDPFYLEFASYNYQVLRDGYFTQFIASSRFKKLIKVVDRFKPDLIIGDGHLLSYFLANFFSIPVIQTTRYAIFPENPNLIWWKTVSEELIEPNAVMAFNAIFNKLGIPPETDASKLLRGDAYLIPGNKNIEPINTNKPHLFYGYKVDLIKSDKISHLIDLHKKNIFITIGGGSNRSNLKKFYEFVLDALDQTNHNIIISDPLNIISTFYSDNKSNLKIIKWVESSEIFPYLDLIIHHGGYSTTMESLWWGVPSLSIPSHTEQEGNGRRMEKLNTGKVLPLTNSDKLEVVRFNSYYGEYTIRVGNEFDLINPEFNMLLDNLLSDDKIKKETEQISTGLKSLYSDELITNFVQRFSG